MKIYFNALGAITSTDTTDEAIRQGTVGNTIKAYFAGKNNSNFVAKLNFTRPDGSKLSGLIMTPSPSDSTLYTFVLNDAWYLGLAGNATFTIYLYNGSGDIVAQGQVTYPIQATDYDEEEEPITNAQYDSLLADVASRLTTITGIKVVDNIASEDMEDYDEGQILYCLTNKQYYEVDSDASAGYRFANDYTGLLGSKRTIVRWENLDESLLSLFNRNGTRLFIIKPPFFSTEFLVQFIPQDASTPYAIRVLNLSNLQTKYAATSDFSFASKGFGEFMNDVRWYDDILHKSNYKDFAVPYSGATSDADLGEHSLKAKKFYIDSLDKFIQALNGHLFIGTGSGDLILTPDGDSYLGSNNSDAEKIATRGHVSSVVAAAIAAVKANAFIVVDTEAYPTLDDFLDDYPAEEGYIYLYPSEVEEEGYLEYIYEGTQWLQIGTTQLDLSNYYNKDEVDDIADGVKADVPKHQVETIFIVDALTNINGRTFQNYTSTEVTIGGYTGLKILKNGNKVTEQEGEEYMEYMTGSYYLPKYNYDKPKNTYFITPAGHIYKPQYDSTNGLVLYDFGDLASKSYADTKVSKTSNAKKIYATSELGNQIILDYDDFVVGNAIVRRHYDGNIYVPETPDGQGAATSKKYVDDSIANAISAVYRYKGTKTCAQINALTGMVTGDVYNVSDSGTLTEGSVQVRAGDNVAWTGSAWDKLAEDIDWDTYNETFLAAGFVQAGEVDSVPDVLIFDDNGDIINENWTGEIELDYMSPPISDISISDVPATLTFDVTQDYDNMITNADWTGIMTITY